MKEKVFATDRGNIHYWVSDQKAKDSVTLVFLPGLTADHRLFEKQTEFFKGKYHILVWDAPGHAASWPFELDFSLMDKAKWLHGILSEEGITKPVLIGQSMGGYVGQAYAELFPDEIAGYIAIDSCSLQRKYYSFFTIWLLRHLEPCYRYYGWKALVKNGSDVVAESEYGKKLMRDIIMSYDGDRDRYVCLVGHGYRILADAIAADLKYELKCPALLICGEKDRAGSCVRYDKAWHKVSGIPLEWIKNAGHNSNTDQPEKINALIESFVEKLR